MLAARVLDQRGNGASGALELLCYEFQRLALPTSRRREDDQHGAAR